MFNSLAYGQFTQEEFRNGYAKVAPTMVVEYKGMGIDDGRYAIELGNILELKNVTWREREIRTI